MARGDFEFLYGTSVDEMQEKETNYDRISLKNSMAAAISNGMTKEEIQKILTEAFESREKNAEPIKYIAQGTHGTCSWDINKEGTLRIYPTNGFAGALRNQNELNGESPWRKYSEHVKHVVVGHGVNTARDARSLFAGLDQCETMKLDGLNTSKAESMSAMFYGDSKLKNLDLNSFDFKNTIDTSVMLNNCESLHSVNMPTFEEGKVINATGMFSGCKNLEHLEAGKTNFNLIPRNTFAFDGCNKLDKSATKAWKPDRTSSKTQTQQKGMTDPNYWMNKAKQGQFKPPSANKSQNVNRDDSISR